MNIRTLTLLIGGLLFLPPLTQGGPEARAAIISEDDINRINTSQVPSKSNPFISEDGSASHDENITMYGIGRGSGLLSSPTATDSYRTTAWTVGTTSTLNNAIANNDYLTFTLEANEGYYIDFDTLEFHALRGPNGPKSLVLQYSIDGGDFTSIGGVNTMTQTNTLYTIALNDQALDYVTGTVEFRLYGYGAVNSTGLMTINDYAFNGTVNATPEPNTVVLLGVGGLLMSGYLRRMKKRAALATS